MSGLWEHHRKQRKYRLLALSPFSTVFYPCKKRSSSSMPYRQVWTFVALVTLFQISPGFYMSAVQVFWKHHGKRRNCLSWACLQCKFLENTVGKGEIAHDEQFLLFPQSFLPILRTFCHFHKIWNCRLQSLSVWTSPKYCHMGKS